MLRAPRHTGFGRDRRASAMVEFAVILPLLLAIWAGMSELSRAIDEWRKLTLLSRTVADLISQGDTKNPISATLMTDVFATAAKVMRPFDASGVRIVVSALAVDLLTLNLVPRVCSSVANANGTARPTGPATDLVVPAGYQTTGVRYVLAEVSMTYTPVIGGALVKLLPGVGNKITLSANIPWPARGGKTYGLNTYTEVVLPGGSNPTACDGSAA